jgi:hypothetical protein
MSRQMHGMSPLLSCNRTARTCTACLYRRKYQHVYTYNPAYQSGGMVSTQRLTARPCSILPLCSHAS